MWKLNVYYHLQTIVYLFLGSLVYYVSTTQDNPMILMNL